ncbi:MAG: dTMP kinase [Patescibacteria group bacterium]
MHIDRIQMPGPPDYRVGFLASVEGIDGVGKSTAVAMVGNIFMSKNLPLGIIRCPTKNGLGKYLRENYNTIPTWMLPALFQLDMHNEAMRYKGKAAIADRWVDSNCATNREISIPDGLRLNAGLQTPDTTYLLDADPRALVQRRPDDPDLIDFDWQDEKRRRFLELAEMFPKRIHVLDATLPLDKISFKIAADMMSSIRSMPEDQIK